MKLKIEKTGGEKKYYNSFLSFGVICWDWVRGINLHVISEGVTITDKGSWGKILKQRGEWPKKKDNNNTNIYIICCFKS